MAAACCHGGVLEDHGVPRAHRAHCLLQRAGDPRGAPAACTCSSEPLTHACCAARQNGADVAHLDVLHGDLIFRPLQWLLRHYWQAGWAPSADEPHVADVRVQQWTAFNIGPAFLRALRFFHVDTRVRQASVRPLPHAAELMIARGSMADRWAPGW